MIKVPNTINVIGTEKYRVSLNNEIKFIPNIMPVKINGKEYVKILLTSFLSFLGLILKICLKEILQKKKANK